jgi:hypothetical protein
LESYLLNLSFDPSRSPVLYRVQQLVILRYRSNGCQRCLEQYPTERKDRDGKPGLPGARCIRTPPDERQRQRTHTTDCDDNNRFSEIPGERVFSQGRAGGRIKKLAAVFTLYCRILNLFGTIRTFFHNSFLLKFTRAISSMLRPKPQPRTHCMTTSSY